jgi:hypothetical protein
MNSDPKGFVREIDNIVKKARIPGSKIEGTVEFMCVHRGLCSICGNKYTCIRSLGLHTVTVIL